MSKKPKLEPPPGLSGSERTAWRRLAESLVEQDLDVAGREELLADFVRLEARIANLRRAESGASETRERLATARALTTAQTERRRLHERLFAQPRGREISPKEGLLLHRADDLAYRASVTAWRKFFYQGSRGLSAAEKAAREAQITAQFGEMPILAVLHASDEEEAEAWTAIERNARRAGSDEGRRRRAHRR